jgi:hypothetical protein
VEEETQREHYFRKAMLLKQMKIIDVSPDGACLFRAMSVLLFGDQTHHKDIRNRVCDYLVGETKVRHILLCFGLNYAILNLSIL